jgi:hypothetical protein
MLFYCFAGFFEGAFGKSGVLRVVFDGKNVADWW